MLLWEHVANANSLKEKKYVDRCAHLFLIMLFMHTYIRAQASVRVLQCKHQYTACVLVGL